MRGSFYEQWPSKVSISASPSQSISGAKGRSPGWAAFDLKQRGKQGLEPEIDIDPYPPIPNRITSAPLLINSEISNVPSLKSFSSVLQLQPSIVGNDNFSKGETADGVSTSKFENKAEIKNKINPSLEKLKELHSWADQGLIEDILGVVDNDFDQAFTLLKSMVSSGCSEESKTKNHAEQRSLFEDSSIGEKIVQAEEGVPSDGVKDIPELRSALEEYILDTMSETPGVDVHVQTKRSDSTTHVQLSSRHIITAPVEPEWEEDDVYLSHRKDAIRAIRSASQHSRAASNAFMRGDRIFAQKLSLKAQEEWMTAEKLNAKAAEDILTIRNTGNDIWKLDLHGLHASEAVCALRDRLWKIETQIPLNSSVSPNRTVNPKAGVTQSSPELINFLGMVTKTDKEQGIPWQRSTILQVVTGTGNHSRGEAALPAAVRSFLVDNGYRFDEVRPGVIDVRPKFRHKQIGECSNI